MSQPAAQRRVGERLQALRKQHRLSQAKAARAISVAKESLGNWENGRRQPHDANLRALASLYGVSPRYIETGREPDAEADQATPDLLAVLNEHSQLLRKIDASVAILADRLEQPPRPPSMSSFSGKFRPPVTTKRPPKIREALL